jgi:hypothetical protein
MTGEWVSISHWGMFQVLSYGKILEKYRALDQARIAEPKNIRDEA